MSDDEQLDRWALDERILAARAEVDAGTAPIWKQRLARLQLSTEGDPHASTQEPDAP